MSHPRSAATAGTVVVALTHLGWPAFCAISMLATAGIALIVWVLNDQTRSGRAAALILAWRGIRTSSQSQGAGPLSVVKVNRIYVLVWKCNRSEPGPADGSADCGDHPTSCARRSADSRRGGRGAR